MARGVASVLTVRAAGADLDRVRIRQANAPDILIQPAVARGALDATVVAGRRGAHQLPPPAARRTGPLGLAAWTFDGDAPSELLVYPDVPAARRLVIALRRGRFRDPGRRTRGPLGLGTDFESVRDYLPDDDVRQINWHGDRTRRPADEQPVPHRTGPRRRVPARCRPVDDGADRQRSTRASTRRSTRSRSVALVADELGDRCGVTVFDAEIRRRLAPRRSGGTRGDPGDPRHRTRGRRQRLRPRVPCGRRRQARRSSSCSPTSSTRRRRVRSSTRCRCSRGATRSSSRRCSDPDSTHAMARDRATTRDVYAAAVALDVLDGRTRVVARLRAPGAVVLEAPAAQLGEACVARVPAAQGAGAPVTRRPGRARPRQNTRPQNTRRGRSRRRAPSSRLCARGRDEALDEARDHEPGAVPSMISTAAARFFAQRVAAWSCSRDR